MAIFSQRPRTPPNAILDLARIYFQRLGLSIQQSEPDRLCFRDKHGYVRVTALPKGHRTSLIIDSCGWEYWARCFLNHTD